MATYKSYSIAILGIAFAGIFELMETTNTHTELKGEAWLAQIRAGKLDELDSFYLAYRDRFVIWAGEKLELTEAKAIEVLQEAIVSFYENIVSGKIISLDHEIEVYVQKIAKNILANEWKAWESELRDQHIAFQPTFEQGLSDTYRQLSRELISDMSQPGGDILCLTYFHQMKTEIIGRTLKYKNRSIIPSHCLRSLQLLKERVQEKLT